MQGVVIAVEGRHALALGVERDLLNAGHGFRQFVLQIAALRGGHDHRAFRRVADDVPCTPARLVGPFFESCVVARNRPLQQRACVGISAGIEAVLADEELAGSGHSLRR